MELGNAIFGHSRGKYECDDKYEGIFGILFYRLFNGSHYGFSNELHRSGYENETFVIRPYCWADCKCPEEQECTCQCSLPNFEYKPTGFKLSWYKYFGRDMYCNQDLTNKELIVIVRACLASIPEDLE